ncbi:MAG: hypothetical protein KAX05_05280, partial [Bacteroidales bacterium]|nr:hypothetical protein [Bacteroidales bacterium]
MGRGAKSGKQGAEDGIVERLSESLLTGYSDERRKGEGAKIRKGERETLRWGTLRLGDWVKEKSRPKKFCKSNYP